MKKPGCTEFLATCSFNWLPSPHDALAKQGICCPWLMLLIPSSATCRESKCRSPVPRNCSTRRLEPAPHDYAIGHSAGGFTGRPRKGYKDRRSQGCGVMLVPTFGGARGFADLQG